MKFTIKSNFPEVQRKINALGKESRSIVREAMNRAAELADQAVTAEMAKVFDRPVPFTLRSLRVFYASTTSLKVTLWFRSRTEERDKQWAVAQIRGGQRALKPMELRLRRINILPNGWFVMPGAAMPLDAYGNMSRGEVSRILNVLGTYTEAGYNKANDKTRARLRKGNAKKGAFGFEYFVNPPGGTKAKHLQPGVYRRVYTAFGQSLKPMLIFVRAATYRRRLDFFGIVNKTMDKHFPEEFDKAFESWWKTGSASALRRGALPLFR
ncbi:hypothetical protein P3G55_18925 [Leptospira sp. 96542]|nr:hypothetical protein [Leptospira sp. 96542]